MWDPTANDAGPSAGVAVVNGTWYQRGLLGGPAYLEEAIYSADFAGTKSGTCRTDYATAPNEESILCHIQATLTATST